MFYVEIKPGDVIRVQSEADLTSLSRRSLLAIYNQRVQFSGGKMLKDFRDHGTAVQRTFDILKETEAAWNAANGDEPAKSAKPTGVKTGKPKSTKAKQPGQLSRRGVGFSKSDVIHITVQENPKRKSKPKGKLMSARQRWELYREGMTVGQFLEAGGLAYDIGLDVKMGYIQLNVGQKTPRASQPSEEHTQEARAA